MPDAGTTRSAVSAEEISSPATLEGRLGYKVETALLVRALTHRSYAYEHGGLPTNERLEFLGDSVLGLVVTDTLYKRHPELPEGQLAKLRAAVVNSRALAEVARSLDLGAFVRLGRGEEGTGGRDKASILADTLEAVIGAVYLDCGLTAADELVHRLFDPLIERSAGLGAGLDWKTSLQELSAARGLGVPEYEITETGPDHEKTFTAAARVAGTAYGTGTGRSKKEAEQQAAETAWRAIRAAADGETALAEAAARDSGPAGTPGDGVAPVEAAAVEVASGDTVEREDPGRPTDAPGDAPAAGKH
ncbi:ribonuclease III [Streptomyces alkaliphilus]|uniref:ribonuclease III n=1 Tax=Streptomyces alkaliphilus TaxID=1472722 RepID=UPI00117FFC02|nr:ribonuclease III [Streptomyces alkaliphilus]MQS07160.1 ribonuclease III [Streptomyces alkaliphilus]